MKTWIAVLLGLVALVGAPAVLARGGSGHGSGGGHGSGHGHGARAFVGVHPGPAFVHHRPFFPRRTVFVGAPVFIAGAAYPYPYYYPPAYAPPAYGEPPPVYIEQQPPYIEQSATPAPAGQVLYYCPDSREYYPNVPTCPSPWMKVVP
jgi:hypothetical protein